MQMKYFFLTLLFIINVAADISIETTEFDTRKRFQPDLQPILLIPGIGGSVLYNNTTRVWVTLTSADYYAKFLIGFNNTITTKYDNYGLNSIRNLDPDNIFTSFTDYFNYFITNLQKIGYVPGVNLFGYPYDWRLSIKTIANNLDLHRLISTIKPIIITHSFGGLVTEQYIRTYSDININRIINIGTPFKGAGGNAIKVFDLGYNLGNFLISESVAKDIALEAFGTYELLPQPTLLPTPYVQNNTVRYDFLSYLSQINKFYPDRYYIRSPINITKSVYYIGNSMYETPYNYIRLGNNYRWTYTDGDGTVPISSAFHAKYHGQPMSNQFDIANPNVDHFGLLSNEYVYLLSLKLSENYCLAEGFYVNSNNLIVIDSELIAGLNGIRIYDYVHSLDCMNLYHNKIRYNRVLGHQCNRYYKSNNETCIYGFLWNK